MKKITSSDGLEGTQPGAMIFVIQTIWLVIALAILIVWVSDWDILFFDEQETQVFGIPIYSLWFGATGGVLSFWFIWARDRKGAHQVEVWGQSDDFFWHVRPIVTALTGFIGCLILALSGDLIVQGDARLSQVSAAVAAFTVGFVPKSFSDITSKAAKTFSE